MPTVQSPAVSSRIERAFRGVDLPIGFTYTPPEGEDRAGLTITAYLTAMGQGRVDADSVTFDTATGAILAKWQEATTASSVAQGTAYEARFVRDRDGETRVFYIRKVHFA